MGNVEILINEEGTLKVVQHYDLRLLLRRLKGLERHRVLRWLNCKTCPLRRKVSNTTEFPRFQDDLFSLLLKASFITALCMGLINICGPALYYYSTNSDTVDKMGLIYLFGWSRFMLLVMLIAVTVAAAIVKTKMKNTNFMPRRKEEVKTISGLIQQV